MASNSAGALTREQHERQMAGIRMRADGARRSGSLGALANAVTGRIAIVRGGSP